MGVIKSAVAALIGIDVGLLFQTNPNRAFLVAVLVILLAAFLFLQSYERRHPSPPSPWMEKQFADLRTLVSSQIPNSITVPLETVEAKAHVLQAAVESEIAVSISAVKLHGGNWQVIHQWGPDIGPTPARGVIIAVRSTDGEKLPIARCEVTDPKHKTLSYDFTGAEFFRDSKEALSQLKPLDFAAAFYPKVFTTEPTALINGQYKVRWFLASDGDLKEWITAAFTMAKGKLVP